MADPTKFMVPVPGNTRLDGAEHPPVHEPAPDAPTVVLAHGWTMTSASWDPVIEELQRHRDVRIVTYDQRGHGNSNMGDDDPSIRMLGEDLHAVVTARVPEGPIVLGGHSMGGMAVMAWAGLHHQEFKARVVGVVLASTAASIEGRSPIPLEGFVMSAATHAPRLAPRQLVPIAVQGRLLFGHGARKEDVKTAIRQIQHTKMPTIGKFFHALESHDEVEALAHFVDVPTHILVGSLDRLIPPRFAEMLREDIPHAELTVLHDLGHMLPYEAPEILSDALISMIDTAAAAPLSA